MHTRFYPNNQTNFADYYCNLRDHLRAESDFGYPESF